MTSYKALRYSMRCLVTGGAGFIGSNLAAELLRRDHDVTILDNFSTGYETNLQSLESVQLVEGDITDSTVVEKAMAGMEAVFHLAASVGNKKSIEDPREDAQSNVIGTINVLEAMRRCDVGRLVYSSSAGIFGEPKYQPVDEEHPAEPDSPYGATKLSAEKLALSYMKLHGIRVCSLRYFNVYGPNQRYDAYGNVIPIFVKQIIEGEPLTVFGDGEQTRDFIHVSDVARANAAAAENSEARGTFNVGAETATSINELIEHLRRATNTSFRVRYDAPRPGDVRHCTADGNRLREVLGIHPKLNFVERLSEYYKWVTEDLVCPADASS